MFFLLPQLLLCLNLSLKLSHPYFSGEDSEGQRTRSTCGAACGRVRAATMLTFARPFCLMILYSSLSSSY